MNSKRSPENDMVDEVVEGFAAELPHIDSLTFETVCRLIVAGKGLEQAAAAMLRQFGFNYTDFDVLGMLLSSGEPYELTPADLLRFTMITSGAMTTCLDRLESAGMIGRRMSEQDRRVRVISLTGKGRAIIEEALTLRYDAAEGVLAGLSRAETRQLNDILRRLRFKGK
ncbi:MAG: MarR family transcriptional regulator [Pseudomonadota bacterium]